jgi:biotin transport system substrate-specific component
MHVQTAPLTLVDAVWPHRRVGHNIALVLAFSLIIALSAQIAIPLPFSPVPVTMQTLTVLLTGLLLGSRLGALTLVAYLAEGVAGLPVFAFGTSGIAVLLGPTGGYLIGFVAAAGLVGFLAERGWDRRRSTTLLAMVLGNLAIYAFGVVWLGYYLTSLSQAIKVGVVPFLAGDAIKIALAVAVLPSAWSLLRRKTP